MKKLTPQSLFARLFAPARATRRGKAINRSTAPAEVDVLETRELMTASLANGVLTIQGNPGDYAPVSGGAYVQVYVNDWNPSEIVVREGYSNGKYAVFPAAQVKEIVFNGTDQKDFFENKTSKDLTANGKKGHDVMHGGSGRNTMNGGHGNDEIYMWNGGGTVNCGPDNDTVWGGDRRLEVYGGEGNDTIWGSSKADQLFGEGGHDLIYGQDGNDFVDGGSGNDVLFDGRGRDKLIGGTGVDRLQLSIDDGEADEASLTDEKSLKSESWWRTFFRDRNFYFNGVIGE